MRACFVLVLVNLIVASEIVECVRAWSLHLSRPSLYYSPSISLLTFILYFPFIGSRAVVVPSPVPRSFLFRIQRE